jgi:hypothetical protein
VSLVQAWETIEATRLQGTLIPVPVPHATRDPTPNSPHIRLHYPRQSPCLAMCACGMPRSRMLAKPR